MIWILLKRGGEIRMIEVIIFTLLAIGLGLIFLLFGYALFRVLLPIWGFIAGMIFGVQGIESLMGASSFLSVSLGLFVGFFVGLLLAFIAYYVYAFAVIIWGASIGYLLGQGLMLAIGFQYGFLVWLVGIVAAVGMVMLFMRGRFPRLLIMLLTSAAGAMAIITGLFALFGQVPTAPAAMGLTRLMVYGSWFWILVWAGIAGFGLAVQYATAKDRDVLMQSYTWEEAYGPAPKAK